METTSLSTPSSISSQAAGVGHYLLLPSASSLLIKPVVVSELLLPVEAGEEDKPTTDAMDSIAASLDQVINPINNTLPCAEFRLCMLYVACNN